MEDEDSGFNSDGFDNWDVDWLPEEQLDVVSPEIVVPATLGFDPSAHLSPLPDTVLRRTDHAAGDFNSIHQDCADLSPPDAALQLDWYEYDILSNYEARADLSSPNGALQLADNDGAGDFNSIHQDLPSPDAALQLGLLGYDLSSPYAALQLADNHGASVFNSVQQDQTDQSSPYAGLQLNNFHWDGTPGDTDQAFNAASAPLTPTLTFGAPTPAPTSDAPTPAAYFGSPSPRSQAAGKRAIDRDPSRQVSLPHRTIHSDSRRRPTRPGRATTFRYRCSYGCNYTAGSKKDCERHEVEKHDKPRGGGMRSYECKCSYSKSRKDQFLRHFDKCREASGNYVCQCYMIFVDRRLFREHSETCGLKRAGRPRNQPPSTTLPDVGAVEFRG
jgi:hypothetical protein